MRITFFQGDHFEWYQARNYFASAIMWGIEGKQLNRNVILTNLAERLRMVGKGEVPLGIEMVGEETEEVQTADPEASEAPL